MDNANQQLVERLKSASNILVTVSRNPSVDQLAACLGLALLLNKDGKHTAAVFSGQVPSTLEFLKPENTLEKNTDSLRDFIISLDKSKADKLRYKVEDDVVRIFITPYKTSINESDLEFSQGDFNVDVVVALGVSQQEDLDEAITVHGRILHDATVSSINTALGGGLGSIIWQDAQASSLCELVAELAHVLAPQLMDEQIATALLTGIVAETNRFSNEKTTPQTMSVSSALMAAGANQQLVATKLEEPETPPEPSAEPAAEEPTEDPNGTIEIEHNNDEPPAKDDEPTEQAEPEQAEEPLELPAPDESGQESDVDDLGSVLQGASSEPTWPTGDPDPQISAAKPEGVELTPGSKLMTGPPTLGGTLTANTKAEGLDPVTDPLSLPSTDPPKILERKPLPEPDTAVEPDTSLESATEPAIEIGTPVPPQPAPPAPEPPAPEPGPAPQPEPEPVPPPPVDDIPVTPPAPAPLSNPSDDQTGDLSLSELEERVKAASSNDKPADNSLEAVRDEVSKALVDSPESPEPIKALNAQPLGDDLHPAADAATPAPDEPQNSTEPKVTDPTAPPPVPPPIPFQFGNPPAQ